MSKKWTENDPYTRKLRPRREKDFTRFYNRRPSLDERELTSEHFAREENPNVSIPSDDKLSPILEQGEENNTSAAIHTQLSLQSDQQENREQLNVALPLHETEKQIKIEPESEEDILGAVALPPSVEENVNRNPVDTEPSNIVLPNRELNREALYSAGTFGNIHDSVIDLIRNFEIGDAEDLRENTEELREFNRSPQPNSRNLIVPWTPDNNFQPPQASTGISRPRRLALNTEVSPRRLSFNLPPLHLAFGDPLPNFRLQDTIFNPILLRNTNLYQAQRVVTFAEISALEQTFYSAAPLERTNYFSINNSPVNSINNSTVDSINNSSIPAIEGNREENRNMAFTATQYVDLIPKCEDEKTVEQFVSIVDGLYSGINDENTRLIFTAIIKSKILGKAFNAIKGKNQDTWANIKTHLVAGLEDKLDPAMASNKLIQIRQKKSESLKEYISRIKEALADLDKVSIRGTVHEQVKTHVLQLNDATAKNTFEFGLWNRQLKTIVVAAQKATFSESQSFAVNQQQTNFPDLKEEEENNMKSNKSPNKKDVICFKCNYKGHIAPDCRTRINKNYQQRSPNKYMWNSSKKNDQNPNYSRQYDNNQTNNNNNNINNRPPYRSYMNNNIERPQWNRSQPNNNFDNRSNEISRPQQQQYANRQNNNRDSNYFNRNKTDKPNEKDVRVIRESDIN